jgi:acid phosphatase class B
MKVSFDFDSTVARFIVDPSGIKRCTGPDPDAVRLMRLHYEAGDVIHIITSRKEKREKHLPTIDPLTGEVVRPRVLQFLRDHGLIDMVRSVNFTNDQLKGHSAVMFNLGIQVHYDDREEELMSLPLEVIGIPAWEMKTMRSLDQLVI